MRTGEGATLITCPDIADGNPWAMYALGGLAEAAGIPHETALLERWSSLVRATHGLMTALPGLAEWYSKHSEAQRSGSAAGWYARQSFMEVADHMSGLETSGPLHWVATQEHALRGADDAALDKLGVDRVSLVVPDSFPKQSAVDAVQNCDRATMYVWNNEAHDLLMNQDVDVRLVKPSLIEGITGQSELPPGGHQIIAKTSGSGMPRRWIAQLVQQLSRSGYEQMMERDADLDWSLYTPRERWSWGQREPMTDRKTRLTELCAEVGLDTCVAIGFPTELTQLVAEANAKGAPVRFLANPPRGQHEVNNLAFLQRHNLLVGEIDFTGLHKPSLPGVERIPVGELANVIQDAVNGAADRNPLEKSVVGVDSFWDQAAARVA